MHDTALRNARRFFEAYDASGKTVADIGAQDINGSLRQVCPKSAKYIGVDFIAGNGVDIVLTDPYRLPFDDDSLDMVVSSSCFEHSEFFWLLFLDVMRTLTPNGLFYLNTPSNGDFHRHPVDCWRFYPDSANALARWGRRNGLNCAVLEQFTAKQGMDGWSDCVAVFIKDESRVAEHPARIIDSLDNYFNASRYPQIESFARTRTETEDQRTSIRRPMKLISRLWRGTRVYRALNLRRSR